MTTGVELGVNQIASQVRLRLRRYLEAQYHIRHPGLIEERRLLLEEPGGISQRPFIEVTPSYAVAGAFSSLQIPNAVSNLLEELASWSPGVGVFPPYRHQADALEKFFSKSDVGNDLIVATGTGSGKTETFLYAILGALAIEGTERPESFARHGIRALLLYPMNALVSDQTARLRRLLGDERLAGLLRERWGRNPRFGMYTSRTPYPGVRDGAKDKRHLDSLLGYYENLQTSILAEDVQLVHELRRRGRWPAKDLVGFYARNQEEQVTVKTGKRAGTQRTLHNWDQRFRTQAADRELLTRHEIQDAPPDLLITNYSMLEYMLLRPIERPIFEKTREWLASDPRNKFTLVLDEAHMYRGVGGAEVGLLIRRLMSRLGISRDRLQCILTSASLGGGSESDQAGRRFGSDLTGETDHRQFVVVRGEREARNGARPGTTHEASVLARVNPSVLAAADFAKADVNETLAELSQALGWAVAPDVALKDGRAARQHIGQLLTGFGPLEMLLELAAGNATDFEELAEKLFPKSQATEAQRATDGLLALGTFSRRSEPGRDEQPLLPTRVHLLFRGLPSQYACINSKCDKRRDTRAESLLGRIYTEPRTLCGCGGRVFELLTHRDCGAAYLRVFATSATPEFLWHERGGLLTEFGGPLHELHIFLEEPHPSQQGSVHPMFVDIFTGRVLPGEEQHSERLKLCYRAVKPADKVPNTSTFGTCPACTQKTQSGGSLKIMDLATKGEQPFANLVREQFVCQLATKEASERHPNEGKKALLFSDGRQKAARLARDLPREVERDSFREALVLACQELSSLPAAQPPLLDETIFAAFVSVCARHHLHFFDRHDQRELLEECARFRKDYGDLDTALASRWRPTPPTRFRIALARQIGDPYYSLVAACAAVVDVAPAKLRILQKRLAGLTSEQNIAEIAAAWLREMLKRYAFDPAISKDARIDEFDYFKEIRAADGLKQFFDKMATRTGLATAQISQLRKELFDVLTRDAPGGDDSGRLVVGDAAVLRLAIDETWLQCAVCGNLQIAPQFGACAVCQDARLEPRPPDHEYMRSRKGFFREPLRAVLNGARPIHITAEEHTAQLSQRDAGVVYATTEEYELRFQDVALGPDKPPVDILSCTTTMEVGIDIGSLTAVGLRTVPPQRENYQQRAGRAGRRGTSVSSVLMFAQGGAHDAHYFANPAAIISGPSREPRLKADNPRLARRHVNAHLLQTFFHSRLDALSEEARRDLVAERPGLLSVLGRASVFFEDTGDMSFADFESWMRERVLTPNSAVINEIASWLPNAIFPQSTDAIKRSFVREIAERLLMSFLTLRDEYVRERASQGNAEAATANDEDSGGLLNLCFDRGLLPSYAFPTDLCSFLIQEWDKSGAVWRVAVAERPQLGKAQALSEYAPGRLLVVNKQTYRVGGVFVDGPPTASPATPLFAQALSRYVGCPRCSFVTIEGGEIAARTSEGAPCPVCRTPLFVREYLDPPSFSPVDGRALREGDRDQDLTFASSAQLPEITGRDEFDWKSGPGKYLQHAYGEDVLLVVANKGKDSAGFSVCESCGAAWIDGEEPDGAHKRPFLIPRHILERETAGPRCNGDVRRGLFLVHDFRTDLLLLRGAFRRPLAFQPEQPWLYDALATLAEALSIGASLHLDIDPGELSAGFRLLPPLGAGDAGVAEVYLFDTASGGAGYSAEAGEQLVDVLARTETLLLSCPGRCERSCTKCLRHYGNRFLHSRLDRRLALSLLRYFWKGIAPGFPNAAAQKDNLAALARFFELEGWSVNFEGDGALRCEQSRSLMIGTYPALLDAAEAERDHPLKKRAGTEASLLPDYLIEHDLPSAYQRVVSLTGRAAGPGGLREAVPSIDGRIVKMKVRDLRRPSEPPVSATVLLGGDVEIDDESFAVRIPNPGLNNAGFRAGRWLVVRAVAAEDFGAEKWLIVLRSRGKFGATGAEWTIAHVRELPGDEETGSRVQLSYGSATGKEYRPERLRRAEVQIVAAVVCHADEAT
jgi:ATP-dependent helicase YprA (DUF1998 family)